MTEKTPLTADDLSLVDQFAGAEDDSTPDATAGDAGADQTAGAGEGDPGTGADQLQSIAARPDYIPEKFWDAETGAPRLEDFAKSYGELERQRMERAKKAPDDYHMPTTFKGFEDQVSSEHLASLKELAKHEGYSQRGFELLFQGIYGDPTAGRAALKAEFGDKLDETLQACQTFCNTLGDHTEALRHLTSFPAGVKLLNAWRMASADKPLPGTPGEGAAGKSEQELQSMMKDPRYWRDRDSAFVAEVTKGFENLYKGQVKTASVNRGE